MPPIRLERSNLARVFAHRGVAEAYQHRPPHPPEVYSILETLITDSPRDVLDIGAGEGALARPLASRVDHVDAVDVSAAMVAAGRDRPEGRRSNLRWVVGAAETCELGGPYALVTAGASLHWMTWDSVMTRLITSMTDHALLAVIDHGPRDVPWGEELVKVIVRHSRSADFDPQVSLVDALCAEGHFELAGRTETASVRFRQPVKSYVEQFHSTASLARELMSREEANDFDAAIERTVRPWVVGGVLEMDVVATLAWGRPKRRLSDQELEPHRTVP